MLCASEWRAPMLAGLNTAVKFYIRWLIRGLCRFWKAPRRDLSSAMQTRKHGVVSLKGLPATAQLTALHTCTCQHHLAHPDNRTA